MRSQSTVSVRRAFALATAVLLLLALPAGAEEPATDPATAACSTFPAGSPITLKGSGGTQTAPFDLDGGAYILDWKLTESRGHVSIEVNPVRAVPGNRGSLLLNEVFDGGAKSGQTHLYDVKPGRYYVAINVPKGWTVTLTALPV